MTMTMTMASRCMGYLYANKCIKILVNFGTFMTGGGNARTGKNENP